MIVEILNQMDYRNIVRKGWGFNSKVKLREYLLEHYAINFSGNKKFWVMLSDEIWQRFLTLSEEELDIVENKLRYKDNISNRTEASIYMHIVAAEQIEEQLRMKHVKNKDVKLADLLVWVARYKKYCASRPIVKLILAKEASVIKKKILSFAFDPMLVGINELESSPIEILQAYIQLFFMIPSKLPDQESSRQAGIIEGYRIAAGKNDAVSIFKRSVAEAQKRDRQATVTHIRVFERRKWQVVKKQLHTHPLEKALVTDYLYILDNEKSSKPNILPADPDNTFGISKEYKVKIKQFAEALQESLTFSIESNAEDFANALTSENFFQEKKVYFTCKTSIVADVLQTINQHRPDNKGKISDTKVEVSGLFYIVREGRPILLTALNLRKARSDFRAAIKSQDGPPEYYHSKQTSLAVHLLK